MARQQGPMGDAQLKQYLAGAQPLDVQVSASGDTVLVACPTRQNGFNASYRPVIYLKSIKYAIPAGTGLTVTLKGSDGTLIDGPSFIATDARWPNGGLSTNNCAVGSNLVMTLSGAPGATFGCTLEYFAT